MYAVDFENYTSRLTYQQSSRGRKKQLLSPTTIAKEDWKLRLAVDDLLRDHQDAIHHPKPRTKISRKDSFSTISTSETDIKSSRYSCRIERDTRCDDFIPIEISFRSLHQRSSSWYSLARSTSSKSSRGHRKQHSRTFLPDSPSILDCYNVDIDDIVFVPNIDEFVSNPTISKRIPSTIQTNHESIGIMDGKEMDIMPADRTRTKNHRQQVLFRQSSRGSRSIGAPPLRHEIREQLPIRLNTSFEI